MKVWAILRSLRNLVLSAVVALLAWLALTNSPLWLRTVRAGQHEGHDTTEKQTKPADAQAKVDPEAKFIGPVWVGCGRTVEAQSTVVGPAVIWDDPDNRPLNDDIHWLHMEPSPAPDDATRLLQLLYSLVMVSFPVEAWRQPHVPDSGAAYLDLVLEPVP